MALQLSLDELQTEAIDHCKRLGEFSVGKADPQACEEVRRLPWDPLSECGLLAP